MHFLSWGVKKGSCHNYCYLHIVETTMIKYVIASSCINAISKCRTRTSCASNNIQGIVS